MSMTRGLLLFALVVPSSACGSQGGTAAGSSSAAATAAPAASTAAPAPSAIGPADDLDVAPLNAALKCPPPPKGLAVRGPSNDPCYVLRGFAGGKAWPAVSPGGEGRFLGRFYTAKAGKITEGYAVLRTRTIPANEAGPGRVPARLALRVIDATDPAASAFDKAIKAFERADVPPKGSPALDLVKKLDGFVDASAMPTASGKVVVLADDHTFVALGASQEIFVVAPRGGGAVSGDGGYGILYPMSW